MTEKLTKIAELNAAARVIREVAKSNEEKADRCKWRGSSSDVAAVAKYLGENRGRDMSSRITAAGEYIGAQHDAGKQPTTNGVLTHLRTSFKD